MRKVFWDNPYQQTLVTKVAFVEGNKIVPEETIVFSFSGGQESDEGFINGMPILGSEIQETNIYYTLPEGHGLRVGDAIQMEVNWPRRYRLMRLHFAAELILEIVTQKFGLEKIGAHIAEDKARIDFVYDKNVSALFESILEVYNVIIQQDKPIHKDFTDIETGRRYWEIEGFSKVPCGGTHVNSTAEVGYVSLKRKNIGGGKERIEIYLLEDKSIT